MRGREGYENERKAREKRRVGGEMKEQEMMQKRREATAEEKEELKQKGITPFSDTTFKLTLAMKSL